MLSDFGQNPWTIIIIVRRFDISTLVYAESAHLIGSVRCSDDLDEGDGEGRELDDLPGAPRLLRVVYHFGPGALVTRHLNVVAVGSVITVPQQQPTQSRKNSLNSFSLRAAPRSLSFHTNPQMTNKQTN